MPALGGGEGEVMPGEPGTIEAPGSGCAGEEAFDHRKLLTDCPKMRDWAKPAGGWRKRQEYHIRWVLLREKGRRWVSVVVTPRKAVRCILSLQQWVLPNDHSKLSAQRTQRVIIG